MVYLMTISMYYVLYKMGNSKSETESMKIKKLKMIVMSCTDVNLRAPHCLVARTPLLKGKFSSGREGALASKFNYDFK